MCGLQQKWNISLWGDRFLHVACQVGRFFPFPLCQLRHCMCNLEKSYICVICNYLSFQAISKNIFVPLQSSTPLPQGGILWANPSQTKLQAPLNWNNKHCKLGVFVKISDVGPACTNPYWGLSDNCSAQFHGRQENFTLPTVKKQ